MPLYPPFPVNYSVNPADHGFLAWTYDPIFANTLNTLLPTAGRLELIKIKVPVAISVTNVVIYLGTAGATLTAGQNFANLYTEAGVLVGTTADQAAAWVTGGLKTMALASGPFACAAGNYYVGLWYNGTTAPAPIRYSNNAVSNINKAAPTLRYASADTGLTTTSPGPFGAQTAQTISWWAALS